MGRKIGRRDRHGLEQQSDRRRTITELREPCGPVAQRGEGSADVLLRRLRARETAVRLDVSMFCDELPVGVFRVLRASTFEELRGRIACEAVTAVGRILRDAACGERGREL